MLFGEPSPPQAFLEKLCDDVGPRLTGSPANAGAMERLAAELRGLGHAPEKVPFTMPGWQRGDDSLVPALERWHAARGEARRLPKGVENFNWVGSDHTP